MKNLIQKIKSNPGGAIGILFVFSLMMYMQLSAWQVFHNIYQCSCNVAGGGWRIVGLILTAGTVFWGYQTFNEGNYATKNTVTNVIILALLVVFSLLAYIGFQSGYGCL